MALRIEGRRMKRVRRNPAALRTILESTTSVLIVCYGNIIRSPFAAHLVRQALGDRSGVSIQSAGLGASAGRPAHHKALDHAAALRVDLSGHAASPVAAERVAASDVIFVMDVPQLVELARRFPEARAKTFLLTCLAPEAPLEIADPVDGDDPMFQRCFDHVSRAVRPIAGVLAAPRRQPSTEIDRQ
jgi:protein-tyrosine phosphatase